MRYPGQVNRVKWEMFDSRTWGRDSTQQTLNQIMNVYVHKCPNPTESTMDDIINIVSLFENCLYFDIGNNKALLGKVRTVRNQHFAHNKTSMVEEKDFRQCLKILISVLQEKSIKHNEKCKEAVHVLHDLKTENRFQNNHVVDLQQVIAEKNRENTSTKIEKYFQEKDKRHLTDKRISTWFIWIVTIISVLMFLCVFYCNFQENIYSISTNKDCITMDFSFPWESDLDFSYYIKTHGTLIGREWLIEDISYQLLHTDYRGILIAAEMGFGKSAIVSKITCDSDKLSPGYPIHSKLMSVHLCRVDSYITLNPGIFVRNMAGSIAVKFPEFGNIIHLDKMAQEYLFTKRCFEDPRGCFDFGILGPLQKVRNVPDTMIIMVDALDECIERDKDNIFTLLYEKIPRLPAFVKFLFTSRNISQIRERLPPGVILYNNPRFKENAELDIKRYLEKRLQNDTIRKQLNIIMFSEAKSEQQINKLVDIVDGNFLFLINAFDFWMTNGDFHQIPDTLEHIYELNLERVFGKSQDTFESVRSLLEILCASLNRPTVKDVYNYLNLTELDDKLHLSRLLSGDLSHFLTRESGRIGFAHKRFADFISSNKKFLKKYYVSKYNGHVQISKYLITNLKHRKEHTSRIDFIYMVYHVANCQNNALQKMFKEEINSLRQSETVQLFDGLLHETVARLNSHQTIKLLIDVTPDLQVDSKDEANSPASYIAAAYGNAKSLGALFENGADKTFARSSFLIRSLSQELDLIYTCKYEAHWGYSLINIASQNGHEKVVKLLIQNDVDLLHENAIGLNSFHLAAEHGHYRILKLLILFRESLWIPSLNHSLYLAAKNGHANVVEYLLSLGAVDDCLPCNGSLYWIPKGKGRLQSKGAREFYYDRDEHDYVLTDDQRFLFCETALEIATQNGYFEVVKILLKEETNAMTCTDARGRTPVFTAAAFDRKDILLYFLDESKHLFNAKCEDKLTIKRMKRDLGKLEIRNYHFKCCKKELALQNFLALYSTSETIFALYKNGLRNWHTEDSSGATPFHYLCCSGVEPSLGGIFEAILSYNDKSQNGSTPIHSAAICRNFISLAVSSIRHHKIFTSVKDSNKRNVLHYLAYKNEQQSLISRLQDAFKTIGLLDLMIHSEDSYNSLMAEPDTEGRTPLHYSAMSGNHSILYSLKYKLDKNLFKIRDNNGMTVLDTLFEHMSTITPIENNYILILPHRCPMSAIFELMECFSERVQILDSFEYFVYMIFKETVNVSILTQRDIFLYMETAINKNRIYTLALLKHFHPRLYKNAIIQNGSYIFGLITEGLIIPVTETTHFE
ncbi:ankyrin repeat domain-containing protein 50-like [Crassostrea angulata]|uniref:ankyrin repeat domain-containing protein 50-like n=1 Tax=Magallana angulata TaxID=2784310 RepID=UPI0022B130E6|nr:ankyrin repeat domain-containing protein 50-like [Crassostrea angulata]